jgi:CO/xanthine dehydrogenase Mo-binding subunit
MNYSVIGKRISRSDAVLQVTGKSLYGADLSRPNMLFAKILRSQHAHAMILRIDTSKAERVAGVRAVITGKDIPQNRFGITHLDQPVLADDKVRYLGDAMAAVAAESWDAAEEAISLIEIDYEPLTPILDPREAMKPDAPLVHAGSNIAAHIHIHDGDIEQGWKDSDLIFEEEISTQMVEHAFIEPHAAIAEVGPRGELAVWTSVQRPHLIATDLGKILKIPMNKIRVVATAVGGGFGGKNEITMEPQISLLAIKTGRPVKAVFTREDEFISSTVRHPYICKYKTGLKLDGALVARKVEIVSDSGAYVSLGQSTMTKACVHAAGPYRIPHVCIDGYVVYTNNPVGGAMRGFGVTQLGFAYEVHMDTIAAKMGLDPLELRKKNLFVDNCSLPTGQVVEAVTLTECTERAVALAGWEKKETARFPKKRGKGIAAMFYPIGATSLPNPGAAFVRINEDGSAHLYIGTCDIGQGSTTVLAQICAEELGIEFEKVEVVSADTKTTPYDVGPVASRATYIVGNAVRRAAAQAKQILFETAADELGVTPNGLASRNGVIYVEGCPEKNALVASIALKAHIAAVGKGRLPIGAGSFNPETTTLDKVTGHGKPFGAYVFAAQIADVEVDTETGETEVLKITAVHDCGKAINPLLTEGQVEGGVAMGLGFGVMEEMVLDKGRVKNPQLTDYVIPTALDVPEIVASLVERPEPTGPFGAKGIGEPALLPTAPAIVNAIQDAVGVRVRQLPVTPEKILKALREQTSTRQTPSCKSASELPAMEGVVSSSK